MNLLPTDCFHILIGLVSGVSCTLIVGKSRIFAPLRAWVSQNSAASCRLLSAILNCQQCLGFWVGLFTGLTLFGFLWGILFALLVSLLAVWNDFALLALSRFGAISPSPMAWLHPPVNPDINIAPSTQARMGGEHQMVAK
jgi:hypothetical protein